MHTPDASRTHAAEAEVTATVYAFLKTWMQADQASVVSSIMAYIGEDFTGLGTGPGDYYPDPASFQAMILREKANMPFEASLDVPWLAVRLIHPTLALAEGRIHSEIDMGTETHVVAPRFSLVLAYRGDRWLLIQCHFSVADAMQEEGDTLRDALERRNQELEREVARRTAALNQSLADLKAAQDRLIQQEKMASLGALTAGIAHEIRNPLNFINNFAQLSRELADELTETTDPEERDEILADLKVNAKKIEAHGQRADGIVRSMLEHSRDSSRDRRAVDLNALVEEHLALAYHGRRARQPTFEVHINKHLDVAVGEVLVVPKEIGRVLRNLLDNAFDALAESEPAQPTVTISTRRLAEAVEIRVADNGPGMLEEIKAKIFEPFFTTKPTGSGTGLGLSLSYDIITQGHGGTLTVASAPGQGAAFVVMLPVAPT